MLLNRANGAFQNGEELASGLTLATEVATKVKETADSHDSDVDQMVDC